MERLIHECLSFFHANCSEIVKIPIDLACINTKLVARLAALFNLDELDAVDDPKDKVGSAFRTVIDRPCFDVLVTLSCGLIFTLTRFSLSHALPTIARHFCLPDPLASLHVQARGVAAVAATPARALLALPRTLPAVGACSAAMRARTSAHRRAWTAARTPPTGSRVVAAAGVCVCVFWKCFIMQPCRPSLIFRIAISLLPILMMPLHSAQHLTTLRQDGRTWTQIFWHLWGVAQLLPCGSCHRIVPLAYWTHCTYHTQPATLTSASASASATGARPSALSTNTNATAAGAALQAAQQAATNAAVSAAALAAGVSSSALVPRFACCGRKCTQWPAFDLMSGCAARAHRIDGGGSASSSSASASGSGSGSGSGGVITDAQRRMLELARRHADCVLQPFVGPAQVLPSKATPAPSLATVALPSSSSSASSAFNPKTMFDSVDPADSLFAPTAPPPPFPGDPLPAPVAPPVVAAAPLGSAAVAASGGAAVTVGGVGSAGKPGDAATAAAAAAGASGKGGKSRKSKRGGAASEHGCSSGSAGGGGESGTGAGGASSSSSTADGAGVAFLGPRHAPLRYESLTGTKEPKILNPNAASVFHSNFCCTKFY